MEINHRAHINVPLFAVTEDDAQIMAHEEIARDLTEDEMHDVKADVEAGLADWTDVMRTAIREAVRE